MIPSIAPDELHDELLYRLFKRSKEQSNGYVRLNQLKIATGPLSGMEGNFLNRLKSQKLVEMRYPERESSIVRLPSIMHTMGPEQEYQISISGIQYVLDDLADPESHIARLAAGTAPSGLKLDGARVVKRATETSGTGAVRNQLINLAEHSNGVAEIRVALDELEKGLKEGNDLGNLSIEDRDQALVEIDLFRLFLDEVSLRLAYLRMIAAETFQWVADKAGGALIGEAAKHVLSLIGKLGGYS